MSNALRNAIYAQSGGVTSVINASASGVIHTVRKHSDKIGKLFAAHNGILGILKEELIDTSFESDETIAALCQTPGGAFGSCRWVLRSRERDPEAYQRLVEVFKAHNIGYFFYNGGNGSADTCEKIASISTSMGYPIQAIHIPKTIDNDIINTDCCPGFGSVAKYIATATKETGEDMRSMSESSTKVFILEAMGRNAGWITAASALAKSEASAAPHILLLPEIAFDADVFLARVKACVENYGYCCITASEGVCDKQGQFLSASSKTDDAGDHQLGGVAPYLAKLIVNATGLKTHYAVADYLQRAARHMASSTDIEQAFQVGVSAVEAAIEGVNGAMIAIIRDQQSPYRWHCEAIPLDGIAVKERKMPADFISSDGFMVTDKALDYMRPLIVGENFGQFDEHGLPIYAKLLNQKVSKQLPDWHRST